MMKIWNFLIISFTLNVITLFHIRPDHFYYVALLLLMLNTALYGYCNVYVILGLLWPSADYAGSLYYNF